MMNDNLMVTMICHRYYPLPGGGADRLAQRIAEPLAARGWRMCVLTMRPPGTLAKETVQGVRVRRLWTSQVPKIQGPLFLLRLLWSLLTARGRGVIHLNQMYREIIPALLVRRLRGSPVVVRVATGGAFGDVARMQTIPAGRLVLRLARRADAVVSLSEQITEELLAQNFAPERVVQIANGVDTRQFTPASPAEKQRLRQELGLPAAGLLVIFTGRLSDQKGLGPLIRAWAEVQPNHPSARLLLLGKDEAGGKFQRLAVELGLAQSIAFQGHSEQIIPLLRAADVYVLPSLSEGLSNALLEAMACGLAVISTNIGGTREAVRDGVDGLLAAPDDAPGLAEHLVRVLEDERLRQQLGTQARQRVEEVYSLKGCVDRYAALYQRLVGRSVQETLPAIKTDRTPEKEAE